MGALIEDAPGVYYILNQQNHKMYIGEGSRCRLRLTQHYLNLKQGCHENKAMQADWNAQGGADFIFDLLDYDSQRPGRFVLEAHYIALHQSCDPEFGYNKRYGRDHKSFVAWKAWVG